MIKLTKTEKKDLQSILQKLEISLKKKGVVRIEVNDCPLSYVIKDILDNNKPINSIEDFNIVNCDYGYVYIIICDDFIDRCEI